MENGTSSYPPTERADISMNSLFSDSFEFDQAEKGKGDNVNGELDGRESNGLSEGAHSANGRRISKDSISQHFTQLTSILNKGGINSSSSGSGNDNVYAQLQRQKQKEEENEMKDVYNLWSNTALNNPAAPPLPEDNVPYMKPRRTTLPAPIAWKPLHVTLTNEKNEDKADEFDVHTAKVPIMPYDSDSNTNSNNDNSNSMVAPISKTPLHFKNGTPDMFGKMSSCFDESGLLYRIVDQQERTWAFYNDSLLYEMHVTCTFGKHSKLEALDNTTLTTDETTNEFIASTVIYPCETERFVRGFVNGFTSRVRALPLSSSYHASRAKLQYSRVIANEIAAVRAIVPDGVTDSEEVLKACVKFNVPFVDLSFLPIQSSIDGNTDSGDVAIDIDKNDDNDGDNTNKKKEEKNAENENNHTKEKEEEEEEEEESIKYKRLPWARPWMYLPCYARDQVRLFRNAIIPGQMKRGDLGDSWFSCSVAALAENSSDIIDLFRHPVSASLGQRERALGAYRVTFNKHGMWHSVIVDDYLPMLANIPHYASGVDQFEIWPAIIQKAYAKLHHSYSAIAAGDPVHALTDLTGCSSMRIDPLFHSAAFHSHGQHTETNVSEKSNNKQGNKREQQDKEEDKKGDVDINKASQNYADLFTRLAE